MVRTIKLKHLTLTAALAASGAAQTQKAEVIH